MNGMNDDARLSWSQTLFRLLDYVDEDVIVTTTTKTGWSASVAFGHLDKSLALDPEGDDELAFLQFGEGRSTHIARAEFRAGYFHDGKLDIDTEGLRFTVELAPK